VDIENAGQFLICIGFTLLRPETWEVGRTIVFRVLRRDGVLHWPRQEDRERMVRSMGGILESPDVLMAFHNGVGHDIPFLMDLGFDVKGRIVDTMVLSHTAVSEFPKGLQWCATLYLGAPVWKTLVHPEEEEDSKG
jgi:hypothetical protein